MVAAVVTVATAVKPLGTYITAPLIEKTGSRSVLVITDYCRMAVNIGFGLFAIYGVHKSLLIFLIMIFVAWNAFVTGWFQVGMQMYIPSITRDLRKVNADLNTGKNAAELLGYFLGGVMTASVVSSGFWFNAATFLAAGTAMFFAPADECVENLPARATLKSMLQQFIAQAKTARETISRNDPLKRIFWLSIVFSACLTPVGTMLAPLVKKGIGAGPLLLGVLECALAAGGMIASLFMRKSHWKDHLVLTVSAAVCATAQATVGIFSGFFMVIAAVMIFGIGQGLFSISESTVIQRIEPVKRAAVFAVISVMVTIIYPLASILTAELVRFFSIKVPFVAGGLLGLAFLFKKTDDAERHL